MDFHCMSTIYDISFDINRNDSVVWEESMNNDVYYIAFE